MRRLALLAGCALAFVAGAACAENPVPSGASPLGRWVTATGNLEVEIAPCGGALCGTVVRVLANRSMSRSGGEMKPVDARDPLGMQILRDFVPTEFAEVSAGADGAQARVPTKWEGQIYNRENAKTYRCIMHVSPGGELMLRGYVGIPLIGSTSTWTRPGVAGAGVE